MYDLCLYCKRADRTCLIYPTTNETNMCVEFIPKDDLSAEMMNSLDKQNSREVVESYNTISLDATQGETLDTIGELVHLYMKDDDTVVDGVRRLVAYAETLELKLRNM